MDIATEILFTDPVLQRIFLDGRRFAPRSENYAGEISKLHQTIGEMQVAFLKADSIAVAEYWQQKMRARWFVIRNLSDGYFMTMPAGHDDGCEHIVGFVHENNNKCFQVDFKKRAALWHRYARRSAPSWVQSRSRSRGRHRPV